MASDKEPALWPWALIGAIFFTLLPSRRNQSSKSIHPRDTTGDKDGNITSAIPAIISYASPALANTDSSVKCGYPQEQWWKGPLEGIAVLIALGLLIVNICQMRSTEKAASAAQDAAQTAKDTLVIAERPWITVGEMKADGPLAFNPDGSVSINLSFRLKNIGHSIATDIYLRPQMMAQIFGQSTFLDPINRQTEWCDKVRKERPERRFLKTLFPDDDTWESTSLQINKLEIDSAFGTYPNMLQQQGNFVAPIVYGCVNYQFPFSKEVHQTRFAFVISAINSKRPPSPHESYPFVVGRNVPESGITIKSYYFGGTFAD